MESKVEAYALLHSCSLQCKLSIVQSPVQDNHEINMASFWPLGQLQSQAIWYHVMLCIQSEHLLDGTLLKFLLSPSHPADLKFPRMANYHILDSGHERDKKNVGRKAHNYGDLQIGVGPLVFHLTL